MITMLLECSFVSLFAAVLSDPTITLGNVNDKLRLLQPTFLMIEQLFDLEDKHVCLEKMFCLLETEMPNEEHNPFKYYSRFLTNTHHDADDMAFKKIESLEAQYPKLSKIIDSIKFGQHTNTSQNCNQRHSECGVSQTELMSIANAYSDGSIARHGLPNHVKRGAGGCLVGSLGCAALGGGCLICAAATAGTCTAACGSAALGACVGFDLGCIAYLG